MGINTTSVITCDGCNETITGEMTFVVLQPQSNSETPFITLPVVVCNAKCLQEYAASLPALVETPAVAPEPVAQVTSEPVAPEPVTPNEVTPPTTGA